LLVAAACVGLGGCATSTSGGLARPVPSTTIFHSHHVYAVGQTGVLDSPSQHAGLRVEVAPPSRSRRPLSSHYGDPPKFGRFVTFRLTFRNTGLVPVEIRRLDFWVRTPGARRTTTNDGNAPFSGASRQLDTTELEPGRTLTNDLTFDVADPTGTLFYAPEGRPALAWTF
jgi:hypothetical protein